MSALPQDCAPLFHVLRTPLTTSIMIDNPYEEVVALLMNAITSLDIGYTSTQHCVYDCTYLYKNELLRVQIRIYRKDDMHLLEFKQIQGDRFVFAEMLAHLSYHLRTPIPGARIFPTQDGVDLTNQENMCEYMSEFLKANSPRDLHLQGMQTVAACARDITRSIDPIASELFGSDGKWVTLVERVFAITTAAFNTDQVLCLVGFSVLVDIMSVRAVWTQEFLTEVSELVDKVQTIEGDLSIHFKAEARKLIG
jgi:hypothetical protein